jgi:diguanylate cyclase (GGDEF)-like protein
MTKTPFDILCPQHLCFDNDGLITHVGPGLRSVISPAADQPLFGLLTILRPLGISDLPTLFSHTGLALSVEIQGHDDLRLRGVVARHGDGGVLSLSFGIALQSAIKRYRLTLQDFAPTDLAPEMLYLIEANQAAMSASRSLTERLQGAKMLAEEQAHFGTLTGLRNRQSLERILDHLAQTKESFSLIQIDLDYFESVNDTLGHAAGDMILQHVANVLRPETRHDDFLIRLGGDEFLLVIKHLTDHARLMSLSTALIRGFEEPQEYDGTPCQISASLGVLVHAGGTPWEAAGVLYRVDEAVYASKHGGRGQANLAA